MRKNTVLQIKKIAFKNILSVLFIAFIFISGYAQKIKVLDKTTLQPIANVLIYSENKDLSVTTNENGKADISDFKNISNITVTHVAYLQKTLSYKDLEDTRFYIFLTEKTNSLDEIILSATRFETQKKDLAQPVELIKSTDIAFNNLQTTGDVIQNTGNVLVQKSQYGGGSPIIRGFETNKVLMEVDGVRMNTAIYRGGHIQNIITLDNAIMDKVEILYGPSSVVYGSDALGGVMHFYTKKPIFSSSEKTNFRINAFTRYSTASEEKTGHFDFNLGNQKLASLTSFTYSDFGDLRQGNIRNPFYGDWGKRLFYVETIDGTDYMRTNENPNVQVGSAYSQFDILQKLSYKPNENHLHTLNLQYSESSDINFYSRLQQMNGSNPKYAEWYYGPAKRFFSSYTFENKSVRKWYDDSKFIIAYQNLEETRHDRKFNNVSKNNRIEKLDILTLNGDFSKKLGNNDLRYGLEGVYNYVNSTAYKLNVTTGEKSALDTRYPDGGSTALSYAAYASHILKINDKFTLNDGLRLNYTQLRSEFIDKTFFPFPFDEVTQKNVALTGNLGLIFVPKADWKISILGSSGFRAPNVDDMSKVFESVPGSVVVPNPDLKPERTYNIDFNIAKTFLKDITVGVNTYYTWYRNAITLQPGTFNGSSQVEYDGEMSDVLTNVNANKAYIYGFNTYLNADLTENFSLYSTLNYTYGRFTNDGEDEYPLDHVSPVFGKTGLNLKLNKFRNEFYAMYNGWKRLKDYNMVGEDNFAEATEYGTPAWVTLNLKSAYQINDNFQIQMALENILDQNYKIFASGISAPGRNFVITLRGNL